ncbi:MAG: hypothetical protein IJZ35_06290 [Clostridia bacterium]|nr:hypothetical protein [Clostridia bacterium]
MKKSLYSQDISPRCEYCANGTVTPDGKEVLCPKRGVMQADSFCKKFKYDALKRKPRQIKLSSDFTVEEFMLSVEDFSL